MKLGNPIRGRRRNAWMLMAGIGAAAAMVLAPVAVGVAQASQVKLTSFPTITTIVATGSAWTATGSTALAECPATNNNGYTYATITGASWIWATVGQPSCKTTKPGRVDETAQATLSTTFTVPGMPQGGSLTLAADNGASVSINTNVVATLSTLTTVTNFETVDQVTITGTTLHQGMNTITITGYNGPGGAGNTSPAGVVAKLVVSSTLTNINLCKDTGWTQWTTPTFSNQGDCISYLVGNGNDPTIPNS